MSRNYRPFLRWKPTHQFRSRALSLYRQMYRQIGRLPESSRKKMRYNLRDSFVIMRYHLGSLPRDDAERVGMRFLENGYRDLELLRDIANMPDECLSLLAKVTYSPRLYMPPKDKRNKATETSRGLEEKLGKGDTKSEVDTS